MKKNIADKKKNGWEHYEIEKEMANANIASLLMMFKRENGKFSAKCAEYVTNLSNLTDEGKQKIEAECDLLDEARIKIALSIAESLTDFN